MKLKNVPLVAAIFGFAIGCNNKGTTNDTTQSSSVATENKTSTTKNSVQVPQATQSSFESQYPNVTDVTWNHYIAEVPIDWEWVGWPEMNQTDFVATFDADNSNYWVWYDEGGNWIGTVSDVGGSGLPPAVNKTISSQFAGFTISSAKKENDKHRTAFEVKMENGTDKMKALIAEDGTLLKKKGTMNGYEIKEKPVKDSSK